MPPPSMDTSLATLRERPDSAGLAGGYGPLIVGAILFVLMVLLAPTVAPEHVVERPVGGATTTTAGVVTTTTTAAIVTTTVGIP